VVSTIAMIGRTSALLVFILSCAAVTGCGKNPTDNLDFKPPQGWTSPPSMFGAKLWIKNEKGNDQILFLLDLPGKATAKLDSDISKEIGSNGYSGGNIGVVEKHSHIKICGDHDAEYMEARGDKNGQRSQTEIVMTKWKNDLYLSLYSRTANAPADPSAETAIHSLCAKS